MNWKGHRIIGLLVRLLLGTLFLAACLHKIQDPAQFALSIATYRIVPTWAINLMAIVLPWVELFTALMLFTGFRVRAASLLTLGMFSMFLAALIWALANGLDMSCGCFASAQTGEAINRWTVVRDIALLGAAVYVLLLDRRPLGLDGWRSGPLTTKRKTS